jgi:hypothetical protein
MVILQTLSLGFRLAMGTALPEASRTRVPGVKLFPPKMARLNAPISWPPISMKAVAAARNPYGLTVTDCLHESLLKGFPVDQRIMTLATSELSRPLLAENYFSIVDLYNIGA